MEKDALISLIRNKTSLAGMAGSELLEASRTYPYAQLLRSLAARVATEEERDDKTALVQLAAVYANDRQVLKELLESPGPQAAMAAEAEASEVEIEHLREELLDDLKRMLSLKGEFERSVETFEKQQHQVRRKAKSEKAVTTEPEVPGEILLEEIKSSKKKVKASSPKQKEQTEIIDQFIKAQPSIPRPKPVSVDRTEDLADLGDTYSENIVSETLVQILVRQGKREKAQEVLRKLIWKFPQKKAYFAAQIEELKK
ncbi:MAG: hypothetical protein K1X47_07420 [Cyclobacteriaceae bacterium]|nr:hypothetical protein [Cyclobacteriaceae bacterium]